MKLMRNDIKPNEEITTFFALQSIQLRRSRNQRDFLELSLYDRTGSIKGYVWNEPVETAKMLKEKSLVKIKGIATMLSNALIINIEQIRPAEKSEVDVGDFLEVVPEGVQFWHSKLTELIKLIKDFNCRRLIEAFLNDEGFMSQFITSPGGILIHHNYVGGLLEHTVRIMEQAALVADRNPGIIDKDLLLTGAFLHDIGKIKEIQWEIVREYTEEGKLLGHISLGHSMLEEKLSSIPDFPSDLAILLKHMLLSHHGSYEYGSPVRPSPPEAHALHIIDNLDAKLNHICTVFGISNSGAKWSNYDKYLLTEIYQKKYAKNLVAVASE
jgi:3'-5' exoribonuclease